MASDSVIIVYGTRWCGDCVRTRSFLDTHLISYHWINIDTDKEGEATVLKLNHGLRSVPTIIFSDGTFLVEPSDYQLARKLKLS